MYIDLGISDEYLQGEYNIVSMLFDPIPCDVLINFGLGEALVQVTCKGQVQD